MNKWKFGQLIASALIVVLLAGCTLKAESKAFDEAMTVTDSVFKKAKPETNNELDGLAVYIPDNLEIAENTNNNLILEDGEQTYILFYNRFEPAISEINYQEAEEAKDNALLESFKEKDRFGYLKISEPEGRKYELQVGTGSVKVTTLTTKNQLEKDAQMMMKMARSVSY
ncbi:hypothetical protein [Sediminibacillus halophilus]|uniref:DUF4367 domain-containing protein n=1 Tax=Sediminibacillus halophilus TaxID=482461 RepID=A0A1G9Y574_9BACI|nr:hypothetical protein [Sediminibacillus halophilus]SDN03625.1 hypothetical protein SAMN05216244_4033 [Sediminibacillus halophilus]